MNISIFSIYLFLSLPLFFSLLVVYVRSIFVTILLLGLFSTVCAMLYFFLHSPDVSMTEVSIGVFLSTAFCLMTSKITNTELCKKQGYFKLISSTSLAFIFTIVLYKTIFVFGDFGNLQMPLAGSGGLYILYTYRDFEIPNMVTMVLGSFRSFDTMGETIIIFTTALGIFSVLKTGKNDKKFFYLP